MILAWNDGHTLSGPGTGAVSIISETVRNRKVGEIARNILITEYENVQIINCTLAYSNDDLVEAVRIANNSNADVFVSNHGNAGGGVGFETFYSRLSTQSNRDKAKIIHRKLVNTKSCLLDRRCCDDFSYKGYDLYVLKNTKMDAYLFELGFVDNQKCINAFNDHEVARALAEGIAEAYNLKRKSNLPNNNSNKGKVINLFSYRFYLENNKDVREKLIPTGASESQKEQIAYDHYINFGKKEGRKPIPDIADFKEKEYLELNKDVSDAVKKGTFINGLDHFLQFGYKDKRKISYDAKEIEEKIKKENEELKKKIDNAKKALN